MIASRQTEGGLELNERKTCIVDCKDDDRRGSYRYRDDEWASAFHALGSCFSTRAPALERRLRRSDSRRGRFYARHRVGEIKVASVGRRASRSA
jgi:hypothetical protein